MLGTNSRTSRDLWSPMHVAGLFALLPATCLFDMLTVCASQTTSEQEDTFVYFCPLCSFFEHSIQLFNGLVPVSASEVVRSQLDEISRHACLAALEVAVDWQMPLQLLRSWNIKPTSRAMGSCLSCCHQSILRVS